MTKPIHIAALVPYKIYPAKMGGQKGIALFYQYLSALLPVTVISTKNNEQPVNSRVQFMPVLNNSMFRYADPSLFFKLKKFIRNQNCTHLFLEHPYYGWLGILLKWFCGIKLVVHSHNIETLRFRSMGKCWWRIMWQYEKMVYKSSDLNFFITDEDRDFAINNFSLDGSKCHSITYGFEINEMPVKEEKQRARKVLQDLHQINDSEKILFFNGTLDYKPNLDAVEMILDHINPILLDSKQFNYKIIICGKGLPSGYGELKNYTSKNIIYAGFVDDINIYFKGADIFINPVIEGGGIKTKLVEALGHNLSAVSTKSGAIGVPATITGNKMYVIEDGDWQLFANAIYKADPLLNTPAAFYDHFYWGNIAAKVKQIIA